MTLVEKLLIFLLAALVAAWIVLGIDDVFGHPSDAPYADWFNGLKRPDMGPGHKCCGPADCDDLPWRQTSAGYEVLVAGEWVQIPPEKILEHVDNPTGHAVTCHYLKEIYCFVRETET